MRLIVGILCYCSVVLVGAKNVATGCTDSSEECKTEMANGKHNENQDDLDTLVLVHALFRHGNRTNDPDSLYPNDPNRNHSYYPDGIGQLNTEGKRCVYRLGQSLRQRYDKFLGPTYSPSYIEGWSSAYDRTKMSLLCALAGLFPPSEDQTFEPHLQWQPIPTSYYPKGRDKVFWNIYSPEYVEKYDAYLKTPAIQAELNKSKDIMDYLAENGGWEVPNFRKVWLMFSGMKTEVEHGLTLPEWTKKVFPHPMQELTIREYEICTETDDLKKLAVGPLLKKILEDTHAKITKEKRMIDRKMILYSGHEINVAFVLNALNHKLNHIPEYGACVLMEIHKMNEGYTIRVLYQKNYESEPEVVTMVPKQEFLLLDNFISSIKNIIPEEQSSDKCSV